MTEYGSELGGRTGCIGCAVAHLPIDLRAMRIVPVGERRERSGQPRACLRHALSLSPVALRVEEFFHSGDGNFSLTSSLALGRYYQDRAGRLGREEGAGAGR